MSVYVRAWGGVGVGVGVSGCVRACVVRVVGWMMAGWVCKCVDCGCVNYFVIYRQA